MTGDTVSTSPPIRAQCLIGPPIRCSGSTVCVSDYIIVPGTISTGVITYDRFCGVNLHPEGFPASNVPIVSCDQVTFSSLC